MNLRLDWCSHKAAKYACENWHYSGSMPGADKVKVGVWEDDAFVGCVIFSRGANPNLSKPYGLSPFEACELTRVALTEHNATVSKIIAVALRFLHQHCPGIKLVVSYADSSQGHLGAVYQAGNWIYEGFFDGESSVVVNGKVMHRRQAYSLFGTTRPKGSVNIPAGGKHKYLMPLNKDLKEELKKRSKPYPKQVRPNGAKSADQVDSGGSTPTRTLQISGGE